MCTKHFTGFTGQNYIVPLLKFSVPELLATDLPSNPISETRRCFSYSNVRSILTFKSFRYACRYIGRAMRPPPLPPKKTLAVLCKLKTDFVLCVSFRKVLLANGCNISICDTSTPVTLKLICTVSYLQFINNESP